MRIETVVGIIAIVIMLLVMWKDIQKMRRRK